MVYQVSQNLLILIHLPLIVHKCDNTYPAVTWSLLSESLSDFHLTSPALVR